MALAEVLNQIFDAGVIFLVGPGAHKFAERIKGFVCIQLDWMATLMQNFEASQQELRMIGVFVKRPIAFFRKLSNFLRFWHFVFFYISNDIYFINYEQEVIKKLK